MQTVPKHVFTHECRAEAVKLVLAEGLGVTAAARKLRLSVKNYSRSIREDAPACSPMSMRIARDR